MTAQITILQFINGMEHKIFSDKTY